MPELPEVETIRRALADRLPGRIMRAFTGSGHSLREPVPLAALRRELAGRRVEAVRRRAKYLLIEAEGARALLIHLGMTGSLRLDPADAAPDRHDHLRVSLDDGRELRYRDPRRFGRVAVAALPAPGGWPEEFSGLGPEPLERGFGAKTLHAASRGRKGPVKPFLLDQGVVAGVGNIYANEALFDARIHPARPACSLDAAECGRLARALKAVLRSSIRRGGSTLRDYRTLDGGEGSFQLTLRVYDRAGADCPVCGAPVVTIRQAGRSTFFCPRCQK